MISRRSSGRSSRWTRPYLRHLVLDQAQDQVGGRDRRLDAEQLEVLQVARVVAARDHALHPVLLARDLGDQDVVLVVAGHGDRPGRRARCRRARAPTARSRRRTGRCARAPPRPPRSGVASDSSTVTSWPLAISSRARFQPDLPGAHDRRRTSPDTPSKRIWPRTAASSSSIAVWRGTDGLRGPARRTSGREPGRAPAPPPGRRRSGAWRSGRSRGSCCRRRWRRRTRRPARCRPRAARRSRAPCRP